MRWRRTLVGAAAGLAVSVPGVILTPSAAHAETIDAATTCVNPFTGAQAGPSSFAFTVPRRIRVGENVPIRLSFAVANSSGFDIADVNSFAMADATPVPLSAGSAGPIPNGGSVTVTLTGTWSPSTDGDGTIAASAWTFNTVAFGMTIPISCTFTGTAPSVTRTVSALPTLVLRHTNHWAGKKLSVSGANWAPSSVGRISLCRTAAKTACKRIGTARTNACGELRGWPRIPAWARSGRYDLTVTVGPDTASTQIKVHGRKKKR